ncbi:MAG: DapH/DapD/GlmU-related protein [Acidithiobacillus ferrooxidans]|nr:DapH/DapD/GlmU-related protein [Acidithiobacillus ferrooxidans]MDD5002615.1 DapH/DapD/GlmU-related protein [Acidithiobacillus sp.]MDD5379136.1 DapH/DapD/GlmU-related protein [Acidithiobacillus sp.]MDD5575511.1 DapH/DapD/GlmU-related protein [Acidithiobacillus sp.]
MAQDPPSASTPHFDPERQICIQSPERILGTVDWGRCIHVGAGTVIQAEGGLSVGSYTVISYDCVVWTINHDYGDICLPYGLARLRKPLRIGSYVWVGRNAIIGGGITIGEGAIIGMGAVLTRSIPPLAVVAGNPARIVGFRPLSPYLAARRGARSLWDKSGLCGACAHPSSHLADGPAPALWRPWPWPLRTLSIRHHARRIVHALARAVAERI